MFKNELQEYTQKLGKQLPMKVLHISLSLDFRTTVFVDGVEYQRKEKLSRIFYYLIIQMIFI